MQLSRGGYFRSPTVFQDQVIFVSEDDLWQVSLQGGKAYRLTNTRGEISDPRYSPDGAWVAFAGREEGETDVYVMPSQGGYLRRLTYLNTPLNVICWRGSEILFRSTHESAHRNADAMLYRISIEGGLPERLPYGVCATISLQNPGTGVVLGRNSLSYSRWKHYRGGMTGQIWVDAKNKGQFTHILKDVDNTVCPFWVGNRIYFLSDHEGFGNLYSCDAKGLDIHQETFQKEFYPRQPASDGKHIVYSVGGQLIKLNLSNHEETPIPIQWNSNKVHLQRKFFHASEYLEELTLHPQGHSVSMTARGRLFAMPLWEQAAQQYGERQGVRYRLPQWLADERLAAISDEHEQVEQLVVYKSWPEVKQVAAYDLPAGRVQTLVASPQKNQVAFSNNRLELHWLDLDKKTTVLLDTSPYKEISGICFSPDGLWLAYSKNINLERTAIFLVNLSTHKVTQITQPLRHDFAPAFDPEGKYLYFLSIRTYNPIPDTVQFAYNFSRSIKPYLITLQKELPNPFTPQPRSPGRHKEGEDDHQVLAKSSEKNKDKARGQDKGQDKAKSKAMSTSAKSKKQTQIRIDLENIADRILEFPVREGLYQQIAGLTAKVLFSEFPLEGDLDEDDLDDLEDAGKGILWCYDFEKLENEQHAAEISSFDVSHASNTLVLVCGERLRVVEAGISLLDEREPRERQGRKSGWLDLNRVKISVDYYQEWKQMFRETWRLQKEFFWNAELSGIDWEAIYTKYSPLLECLGSRSELSDLIWEMQGELRTSHAYEWGGDYHHSPDYTIGKLGADFVYDAKHKGYRIEKIYKGDVWKKDEHSPLIEPGVLIKEGDILLAINSEPLDQTHVPGQALVNRHHEEILLTVKSANSKAKPRQIFVHTLPDEKRLRYREWVRRKANWVLRSTDDTVGYLHLPDMQSFGIAEFHRQFLALTDKHALIVDTRYNAGGRVSPLILEKLTHTHLGYDVPRWGQAESYPFHAMPGNRVLIANEFTGSDGDMFCHAFKTLKLGPMIGKRTWGGVVGIDGRYHLVDGTITTQPQFSAWFHDCGFSLENKGVSPDEEVEISPQDYREDRDPQLDRAIEIALAQIQNNPLPPPPNTMMKMNQQKSPPKRGKKSA